MEKAPVRTEEPSEEKTPRASRLKHRATACKDKRRDHGHCGLCGSGNVAYHGVLWCLDCGSEIAFFSHVPPSFFTFDLKEAGIEAPCGCSGKRQGNFIAMLPYVEVTACLDCGAIGSGTCPVCTKNHGKPYHRRSSCWTGKFGEKYCRDCGLRTKSYLRP
jgi:hypothetical protein